MKKEISIHVFFWILLFTLITLAKRFFAIKFSLFWLGGFLGTILPDIDHILYVYFLKPHELTSQRVASQVSKGEVWSTLRLLAETRSERKHLIFHTAFFQIIFLILTFWVVTSTGSLFGKGIVLAFSLHLLIDQLVDLMQVDSIANWFANMPIDLGIGADKNKSLFWWLGGVIIVLVFSLL